jgi:hypothetical protein
MIGLFLGRPRKGSNARRINSCSTSYSSNNRLKGRGLSLMSLVYAQGGKQNNCRFDAKFEVCLPTMVGSN